MALVLAPIPSDKLATWKSFMEEMNGSRKADFEDFNRRHRLTKHEAWLCETPGGPMVVVIHEGPGAAELMPSVAKSTNAFDQYFASKLGEIHGVDLSKAPPGKPPERKIAWSA